MTLDLDYDTFLTEGVEPATLRRTGRLRLTLDSLAPLTVTFRSHVKGEGEYWIDWRLPWAYHTSIGTVFSYLTIACQCGGIVEELHTFTCYDCGAQYAPWSPSVYWDRKLEETRQEWVKGSLLTAGHNELDAALKAAVLEDAMAKLDAVFAASL